VLGLRGPAAFAASARLDHYRQFGPYLRAAIRQFSPKRQTLTGKAVEKFRSRNAVRGN